MSEYTNSRVDKDNSIQMFETIESNVFRVESQFNSFKNLNIISSFDSPIFPIDQVVLKKPKKSNLNSKLENSINYTNNDTFNRYNPYQIPPDWIQAEIHSKAQQVGRPKKQFDSPLKNSQVCPCCLYQIQKGKISMLDSPMDFSFLGSGYPLFFSFMKYCTLILITVLVCSGGYNLLTNYEGNSCSNKKEIKVGVLTTCQTDWISIFTLINKSNHQEYIDMQNILNLVATILLMILLIFFRIEQKQIDLQCDTEEVTPSDYTILIKNIPNNVTEEDLRKFFSQIKGHDEEDPGKGLKVVEISYVYNIDQIVLIEENIKELISQKKISLKGLNSDTDEFRMIASDWDDKIHCLILQKLSSLKCISDDEQQFTGYAFVSFETENEKQYILQNSYKSFWHQIKEYLMSVAPEYKEFKYRKDILQVMESPEPLDIIWANLTKSDNEKSGIRKITFYSTLIIMVICAYMIFLLNKNSNDPQNSDGPEEVDQNLSILEQIKKFGQLDNLLVSFVIILINNVIIQLSFRYIVNKEYYNTHTQYNVNLAKKLTFALFINSALVISFINFVYSKNVYFKGGLIYIIFYYFAIDLVLSILSYLIDYEFYIYRIKRWWYERKGKQSMLTQQEANKICEFPSHQIEICYADLMNNMYITLFFSSAVPMGLVLSVIGFSIYYWISKYILINQKKVDYQIGVQLSLEMTNCLEFIIPLYAISNALFEWSAIGSISTIQIFTIVFSIIYSIIPIQIFLEHIIDFDIQIEEVNYQQASYQFITTYRQANPLTSFERKYSLLKYRDDSFVQTKF